MKTTLLALFIFLSHSCFSQQTKIDILLAVNAAYKKEDSLKVIYLGNIIKEYSRLNDMEKLEEFAGKAISIAMKLPSTVPLSKLYFRLGLSYHGKSKYLKAIEYYHKGIEVANKRNDKDDAAGFYLNLSALYGSIPDYSKALSASESAVNLYNQLGDADQVSSCYMNIGALYLDMKDPIRAIAYIEKALLTFNKVDNGINYGTAIAYQAIANAYQIAGTDHLKKLGVDPTQRFSRSLVNLNKSLKIAETLKETSLEAQLNNDIGQLYEAAGNKELARQYYKKALAVAPKDEDKESLADILFSLGNFNLETNDYAAGKNYLEQSLEIGKQTGLLAVQKNALEKLSRLYERTGQFDSAFILYQRYIGLRDSIFNQEKEREITRKQLQLDFSIKENDYKLVQQITDGKLKEQVLLAMQQQQELTLKQQQLQLINKEKDLQQLAYLKRQSELQNEKLLQAGVIERNNNRAKYDKDVRDKQIAAQQTQISFDKKVKIFLAIAIAFGIIITGLIYYNQRRTKKLNKIINEQKLALQQLGHVKDKIFSVVSHDMRAPVNSLMSFIDVLENGNIPPEKLALYSKELKQNLSYTSSLMNNLLTWAASQMQGFKPVKESFDLSVLVTEVANGLLHHSREKQVAVQNDIPAGTLIRADQNMTAAVLRNLLSNAIKFSHKHTGVNISAAKSAEGTMINIKDEGTGMQPAQLDAFNNNGHQQAESKRGTANEKGTGLGLLLCKTFVGQMGGTITASSNGKGMLFRVWLPNLTPAPDASGQALS